MHSNSAGLPLPRAARPLSPDVLCLPVPKVPAGHTPPRLWLAPHQPPERHVSHQTSVKRTPPPTDPSSQALLPVKLSRLQAGPVPGAARPGRARRLRLAETLRGTACALSPVAQLAVFPAPSWASASPGDREDSPASVHVAGPPPLAPRVSGTEAARASLVSRPRLPAGPCGCHTAYACA